VRDSAKAEGLSDEDALKKEMEMKAIEFVTRGSEVYQKV
jgi:phosphomethylpyrimidine synthase